MDATNKKTAEAYELLNAKITEGNKLIAEGKPVTAEFLEQLRVCESEYADCSMRETFDNLGRMEMPMIEAIRFYSYPVMVHTTELEKETKRIVSFDLASREKQIDLLRFAKYCDLDHAWVYDIARFNQSLCLRAATEIGYTAEELKQIAETYYMQDKVKEMADGKPISNNQLCQALQTVIDAILPDGTYKCNNHDVKYLLMTYTKKSKKVLGLATANDRFMRTYIMDIMHRIITGKLYSIEYKSKKDAEMFTRSVTKEIVEPEPETDDMTDEELFEALKDVKVA